MTHAIGHLHHRIRFYGTHNSALYAHLDRLIRGDMLDAYSEALDAVLQDDPTVYVVREVKLRVLVSDETNDRVLARTWGRGIAKTLVQMLDDTENVKHFEDQAAFTVSFIEDWLHGRAWGLWYYGAFAYLRDLSPDEVVRQVLLDNRAHLPSILAHLSRQANTLQLLFRKMSTPTLTLIWQEGLRASTASEIEVARPLLVSLMQWADRLNLWRSARPAYETLIDSYFGARRLVLDWRDTAALTTDFADMVLFCIEQGWLLLEADVARLETLIDPLDWLDRALLRQLLVSSISATQQAAHVHRPRQSALLQHLAAVLSHLRLNPGEPDSAANALHWYAALVAAAPQWIDDPLALDLIRALLALWAELLRTAAPEQRLDDVRRGKLHAASPQGRWLATLGPDGVAIAEALLRIQLVDVHAIQTGLETQCAGLFLLLRAILDTRVLTLVGDAALTNVLLAALAWHWAEKDEHLLTDPGWLWFAGLSEAVTWSSLREAWHAVNPLAFQTALMRVLVGQRSIRGEQLTLHRIILPTGETAVIAEADAADIWVFGQIGAADLPQEWLEAWEAVIGNQPTVVEATDSTSLMTALAALGTEFDLTTALTAAALLRWWARWLGSFAASSIPYLLRQFIWRAGTVAVDDTEIRVQMESRPLDIVLGSAGYLVDLESVPWLGQRRVRFEF